MSDQEWKRIEYTSWDDAFRGLAPEVRQQSVRVAAYTQAIYIRACKDRFLANNPDYKDRIRGQYADLSYKCGLYHQLGKALVPPEYQIETKDFSPEERAVYRKYTSDGRVLVSRLQEMTARNREKRKGEFEELPTENIPWLMIRESCEQHMERFDGSGYPDRRKGADISPIAQIVGLAKELDRRSSETKSETPFDDALQDLRDMAGKGFSEELIHVLNHAEKQCRAVYRKYIHYTMTLPETVPLVERKKDRPMGLVYRPLVQDQDGEIVAYEAAPWFGGVANDPDAKEGPEDRDLAALLRRTGLVKDITEYFIYEITDTLTRLSNCKLNVDFLILDMLSDYYHLGESQLSELETIFKNQPLADKSKLILTISEDALLHSNKVDREIIERYLKNGYQLMLDGYHPKNLTKDDLKSWGFRFLRIDPELYFTEDTANIMTELRLSGFTLIGARADTPDALGWQIAAGILYTGGTMTGVAVEEDDLIRNSLLRERTE